MKLLINYNIYIIITLLLYDTIDGSEKDNIYIIITLLLYDTIDGSEKERWIRELLIDRSRCGKMKVLNNYSIYLYISMDEQLWALSTGAGAVR